MFKPRTFNDLCQAMRTRAVVEIDTTVGVVNGIQPEDNSGRNWIVTINPLNSGFKLHAPITQFFRGSD